jgi:hypothetical protein
MRKCSFIDCKKATVNNQESFCATCQNRPEQKQCDACGKPEPSTNRTLSIHPNLIWRSEKAYSVEQKLRSKLPTQFQTQLDPLLPDLQLSAEEVKVIEKLKNYIDSWFSHKGGKQHQIEYFQTCSTCSPEVVELAEEFAEQNPLVKTLSDRLKEVQEKAGEIVKQAEQAMGESEWEKVLTELNEEIYGQGEESRGPPEDNGPTTKTCAGCGKDITSQQVTYGQIDSSGTTKNYCSTKCLIGSQNDNQPPFSPEIIRLCSEIDRLKNEIDNLQNQPNSDNSNALAQKEQELKRKEKKLEEQLQLKKQNKSPKNQPAQNNNSPFNLLWASLGIVGGGL